MNSRKVFNPRFIITSSLLIIAIIIGTNLAINIYKNSTEVEKNIEWSTKIKEKLHFLKNIQIAYHQKYGKYADDWLKLKSFIKSDKFYLTQQREKTITLSYGADTTIIRIDTLNIVSVHDSLISRGKYPNLDINELSKIPNSELDFKLEAINNTNSDMFIIQDTDPKSPKIKIKELGNVPLQIGSLDIPTTKGNWEK